MREVSLDTETTGFDPDTGDRIVEIGCVEMVNRITTGNRYHVYINPERSMPEEAFKVHGLSEDFLKDKPKFAEVKKDFLEFIGNDPLVIHNAAFDMKFLNAELKLCGDNPLKNEVKDTLVMARRKFPGRNANLDALCNRYKIDKSSRTLHGALVDADLLAKVYLEITGGANYNLALPTRPRPRLRGSLVNRSLKKQEEISENRTVTAPKSEECLLFKPTETEMRENKVFREKYGF
ncbi:DNA polymerase III subunit epsilon [Sulfitobacter sp. R18_1]|uniref:DNA polymerase III subunit epsilon n=1 Tax=Sulfitobacter sp. R18_1 TaxID=2821104 RepID=UPI001ADD342F|nr:DNA polymerase III subunit epsilon [Sulfitobacter sp. R18_1]MBO9428513.1 DNA polymerase III subunit epsilon [Sulfitobacter sp. R18_1]